jgi:hypothetical protein
VSEAQQTESQTVALPTIKQATDANLNKICDHLAEEGFRPKLDDDGSIGFKFEGWRLYLDAYASNGGYRLYCCVFWELDPADRTKALIVANSINAERRCVKAMVSDKNTVWIAYETHYSDAVEYAKTVASAADFIVSACKEYREEFRRELQPVTLN